MSVFFIDENSHNQRLDNFLVKQYKVPRPLFYKLIRTGKIRVNEQKVPFHYKLQSGDTLSCQEHITHQIPLPHQEKASTRICKTLDFLYEDDNLVAVNKPAQLACHGGSHISIGLIESLRMQHPRQHFELVHRLDKDTSGVILIAKKRQTLTTLQKQFAERRIRKTYLAMTHNTPPKKQELLSLPLFVRSKEGESRTVSVNFFIGKPADTFIQQIAHYKDRIALIKAHPYTGRTHQIRVHLSHIGCPIIGDQRYGMHDQTRLFLHAYRIIFQHPCTKERLTITAPLPKDFTQGIKHYKIATDSDFFVKNSLLTEDFS